MQVKVQYKYKRALVTYIIDMLISNSKVTKHSLNDSKMNIKLLKYCISQIFFHIPKMSNFLVKTLDASLSFRGHTF